MKANCCQLCGAKLIQRGKVQEEFSTKNFGTEEKPKIQLICKSCQGRFSSG